MLKELLNYIYDQAASRASEREPHELEWLSDESETYYSHNGEVKSRPKSPEPRKHSVDTTADLVAAAKKWGMTGTIWVSNGLVVLITGDEYRDERVTLQLHHSDTFNAISRLEASPCIDQPALIKLLRREFRGSPQSAKLLGTVRKLKFNRGESGYSNIQHGNESMGRTVEAAVTGADEPFIEELTLPVAVYKNAGERVTIALSFDVDTTNQKFYVKPLPDEMHATVQQVLAGIRADIQQGLGENYPVFFGRP